MAPGADEPEFNAGRAELFEALGHPVRIRILQALDERPMGFAELKKKVGIESSGHLSFHLTKLEGLLKAGDAGAYSLTDEGKEALRVVSVTKASQNGTVKVASMRPPMKKVLVAAAIIAIVLLGALAVFQQQQIGSLTHEVSKQYSGTTMINGTRYAYVVVPQASLNYPAVVKFDGVTFNITSGTTGNLVVFTSPGSVSTTPGSNGTVIFVVTANNATQYSQGIPITIRAFLMPSIKITFSDGASESYFQSVSAMSNPASASNVWLSHHESPQAGVLWDSSTSSYVLYVSVET